MATAPDTAPASINVLVLPADGSKPRLERIETVKQELIQSTYPPNKLFLLGSRARDDYSEHKQDGADVQIITQWLGHSQPAVDLLPDTRSKYWPAEAWEARAAWALKLEPRLALELEPDGPPLRHCFFTMHTDNLERNKRVGNHVWGDVFVLRVSDARDENGRRFYVDEKPEDLSPKLVNCLCDRAAVVLEAAKTWDYCCEEMSKMWGIKIHSPRAWLRAKVVDCIYRIASTSKMAKMA